MKSFIDRKLLEEEKKISKILEQVCLKADIKLDSQGFPIGLSNHPFNSVSTHTASTQTDSSLAIHAPFTTSGKLFIHSEFDEESYDDQSVSTHSHTQSNRTWEAIVIEQLSKENEYILETKEAEVESLKQQIIELEENLLQIIKWRNSTVNQSLYLITSFEKKLDQIQPSSPAKTAVPKKGVAPLSSALSLGGTDKAAIQRLLKQLKLPLQDEIPLTSNYAKHLMNQLPVNKNLQAIPTNVVVKDTIGKEPLTQIELKSDNEKKSSVIVPAQTKPTANPPPPRPPPTTSPAPLPPAPAPLEKIKSDISLKKLFPSTGDEFDEDLKVHSTTREAQNHVPFSSFRSSQPRPTPPPAPAIAAKSPPPPPPKASPAARWPPARPPPPTSSNNSVPPPPPAPSPAKVLSPRLHPPQPSSSTPNKSTEEQKDIRTNAASTHSDEKKTASSSLPSSLLPVSLLQAGKAPFQPTQESSSSSDSYQYCLNCKHSLLNPDLQYHELSVHQLFPFLTVEREYLLLKLFYLLSLMQHFHSFHPLQKQREMINFQFYSLLSSSSLDLEKKRKQILQMSYISRNCFFLFLFTFDLFDEKFTLKQGHQLMELCLLIASKKSGKPRLKLNYADFVFTIIQFVQAKYQVKSSKKTSIPTSSSSSSIMMSDEKIIESLDLFFQGIAPIVEYYLLNPIDLDHLMTLYWDISHDDIFLILCEHQEILYNNYKRTKSYGIYHPEQHHFTLVDLVGGTFTSFENYCINYHISPLLMPISSVRLISQTTRRLCGVENFTYFFFNLYSILLYLTRKNTEKKSIKKNEEDNSEGNINEKIPLQEMKAILQKIVVNNDSLQQE